MNNNINRPMVKAQAKKLIKDKVFILFVITFVAIFLVNGISVAVSVKNSLDAADDTAESYDSSDYYNSYDYSDDDYYSDYYDDFEDYLNEYYYGYGDGSSSGSYDSDNPIDNFGSNSQGSSDNYGSGNGITSSDSSSSSLSYISTYAVGLIGLILSPLLITLMGFYVSFIKRNPDEELKLGKELGGLFKKSFDSTYLKKLVLYVLKSLFTTLLSLIFFVPGIIYNYSTYFACQIMNDYPNLKPTEAGKLSRKIIKGNRTELFLLDLSFIPWYLLCCVTLGIASIYVLPYIYTTQALYYENFRLRALAQGRITEDDFLSEEERKNKYAQNPWQNGNYYNPNNSDYANNQNGGYTNGYGNTQGYDNYNSAQQNNYYYQPQNSNPYTEQQSAYQSPNQQYYQPTEAQPQEQNGESSNMTQQENNAENTENENTFAAESHDMPNAENSQIIDDTPAQKNTADDNTVEDTTEDE